MENYNELLSEILRRYHIYRGENESEDEFKTRLVYSVCGMFAYASLWDNSEEVISVVHMKRKIGAVLANYKSVYPELCGSLPQNSEALEDEIVNQFLKTGIAYHRPSRIAASMKREELFGGILFQRGIALDNIDSVSGIGFYSKKDGEANLNGVKEMFGLEQKKLEAL